MLYHWHASHSAADDKVRLFLGGGGLSSPAVVAFSTAVLPPLILKFPSLCFLNFAEYTLVSG